MPVRELLHVGYWASAWVADVLRWHGYQLRRPRGDPSTYALSQATVLLPIGVVVGVGILMSMTMTVFVSVCAAYGTLP